MGISLKAATHEFLVFGLKQARACIFAGSFFVLLFASNHLPLFGLARYDFIFIVAVLIQVALVVTKLETKDELKTICIFHIIGLCLEIFKVHPEIGSWAYPEEAFFKFAGVPLYSGFMYAAVASYMIQSWRIFKLRLTNYPSYWLSVPLSIAIYLNFFTHHYIPDFRWVLAALVLVIFWKSDVYFVVIEKVRKMKVVVSFLLIGFFIWVAENISTYLGAWQYPDQVDTWTIVSFGKISSWALLVIISFLVVADLRFYRKRHGQPDT